MAFTMMLAQVAAGQFNGICEQTPVFADDPPPILQGYFTSDIGMDGNGKVAIVGEIFGDPEISKAGFARFFSQSSGQWDEVQTVQHAEPFGLDSFGASVDISENWAIISAPGWEPPEENTVLDGIGAAFLFERDILEPIGDQWIEHSRLDDPEDTTSNLFGGALTQHESVSIDGSIAAVSAIQQSVDGEFGAGVVYIFTYDSFNDEWAHEETLVSPDPQANDQFGYSIEISGSRIIIGAPFDDHSNLTNPGSAFVFKRNVTGSISWSQEAHLTASSPQSSDLFGRAVSIDGNAAVVGAPSDQQDTTGFVAFFRNSPTVGWGQSGLDIIPSDDQDSQRFGYNVSLSGTMMLIGAPFYNSASVGGGAGYLFQNIAGTWTEQLIMHSEDSDDSAERGGETLAVSGDEVFVGVPGDDFESTPTLGATGSVLIYSDIPDTDCTNTP